ncbi:MAG TPA: cytochrome c oxidase subunit II [Planctomycetota bacterium]
MNKFWIFLFALVPLGVLGIYFWAHAQGGALWFPAGISEMGEDIDRLFWIILGLTGTIFFGVEALFLWFLFKYDGKGRDGQAVKYTHGNHRLETLWTVIPAGILVFLAVFQFKTWKEIKFRSNAPDVPLHARVTGGQFEWRFRYPGADGRLDTPDDLEAVNVLHVWKDRDIKLQLESRDVVHSFFIPAVRIKQDLVPGMKQLMWFKVTHTDGQPAPDLHEIACAELCGWGHYKMKGRLVVHETEADYRAWLTQALAKQNADQADLGIVE